MNKNKLTSVRENKRRYLQVLSFYATRHHPCTKQVHSRPYTIILIKTKELR
ncbi:TPA: hypothetical protein G8N95_002925 [Salmonella enterica]|uniref:Uncharacterized protein n=1 Tax=Salmonella enterica TaxID=28901 RepID=A0A749Z911_SALER|nr:hypothetical protein [Salmonella enterica]